jgi:hypothetical protein
MRASRQTSEELRRLSLVDDPDVLSLDIDGIDYFVMTDLLDRGLRPKIIVVEYNSTFGPTESLSVSYDEDFDIDKASPTRLYYGVSVSGWRKALGARGYRFVTVDLNGVNAVFIDADQFPKTFVDGIRGLDFRENTAVRCHHRVGWEALFEKVKHHEFVQID